MTTPKAKFCSRLAKLSYRAKTVRRAARRDPSYRLVPSPRMQYVKRYGRFSSDQFLTRTAFFSQHAGRTPRARRPDPVSSTHRSESLFLVCQRMCMNPGPEGFFFHVTNSGEHYEAPERARSKRGENKLSLFGGAVILSNLDEPRGPLL